MLDRVAFVVALALALALGPLTPSAPASSRMAAQTTTGLSWELVSRRPHDPAAWTQGLQLDDDGRLYESTGLRGRSTLREVDPATGTVLRSVDLPEEQFGEGLAVVGDRLIQLTWQEGLANVWDSATFELLGTFSYEGEGWGLCFDGRRLVMSDGSDRLVFRDPTTFEVTGDIHVEHAGLPEIRLNELECVDGLVWSNAWLSETILRIDPETGRVTGSLDLGELVADVAQAGDAPAGQAPATAEPPDVLNGLAWDEAAGTFLVTGKLWPALFEIRVDAAVPEATRPPEARSRQADG
jgi:glutaminyl-peptide cyclotransferase